jgi:hypothetical protein
MKTLAEKIEVMQAAMYGKPIENISLFNEDAVWEETKSVPHFNWDEFDYRVKKAPKTKPSINWDYVSTEFKWMATDEDGQTYLFSEEPTRYGGCDYWDFHNGVRCIDASCWSSYVHGTCDWKDSLVERPTGEENA